MLFGMTTSPRWSSQRSTTAAGLTPCAAAIVARVLSCRSAPESGEYCARPAASQQSGGGLHDSATAVPNTRLLAHRRDRDAPLSAVLHELRPLQPRVDLKLVELRHLEPGGLDLAQVPRCVVRDPDGQGPAFRLDREHRTPGRQPLGGCLGGGELPARVLWVVGRRLAREVDQQQVHVALCRLRGGAS